MTGKPRESLRSINPVYEKLPGTCDETPAAYAFSTIAAIQGIWS